MTRAMLWNYSGDKVWARFVLRWKNQSKWKYSGKYSYTLIDETGLHVHDPLERGDLIPYLSSQEIQSVKAFVDAQLAKVQKRIS